MVGSGVAGKEKTAFQQVKTIREETVTYPAQVINSRSLMIFINKIVA